MVTDVTELERLESNARQRPGVACLVEAAQATVACCVLGRGAWWPDKILAAVEDCYYTTRAVFAAQLVQLRTRWKRLLSASREGGQGRGPRTDTMLVPSSASRRARGEARTWWIKELGVAWDNRPAVQRVKLGPTAPGRVPTRQAAVAEECWRHSTAQRSGPMAARMAGDTGRKHQRLVNAM